MLTPIEQKQSYIANSDMFITNIGNELTVDKMKLLPEVNGAITTDLENNATYNYNEPMINLQ